MDIIEEIEAEAFPNVMSYDKAFVASVIVRSPWWPHIKDALKASEQLYRCYKLYGKLAVQKQVLLVDVASKNFEKAMYGDHQDDTTQ